MSRLKYSRLIDVDASVYDRTMKAGPDIAMVAALVGDPARANMLTALIPAAR